ncbi:MAG TPA: GIY-YIG nuclease family protein [Chloroflexia bacterium]|jgi:putative endonuclease|nr:GIY-YIG nuclease family protein [Chloroflexia bacterium]
MRQSYVYMMANKTRTLYVGVTNNIERRVYEHKNKLLPGFTSRYGLDELVYLAETEDVREAIAREKQIKGWSRAKKVALIEEMNPEWEDLSAGWFSDWDSLASPPDSERSEE